ncbi:MAG: translation initiation factor IF-2 [Pegethrix bostrychoides GSE-TBD4-15B]|jgi:translation initiation factor IF-2|uniref:Translation initiation factor IF-2 n=1 Tax=Pegethrix bostrychoides GSE-TBD4-15B TaxID=2839662 RepID=A0A951U7N9_9CYAN|nr:translation initiation factor IF-2 [Pegethrix bostrychoides GSE-TBD4-15B]
MNNGKVRIYELSKELNLDNREILAVCDQLDISVKSHSSTITEAEAAKIRSAAENLVNSAAAAKLVPPRAAAAKSVSSKPVTAAKPANAQPVKKQQILEIRKNRPLTEPPKRPDGEPVGGAVAAARSPLEVSQTAAEPPQRSSQPSRPSSAPAVAESPNQDERQAATEVTEINLDGQNGSAGETNSETNGGVNGSLAPAPASAASSASSSATLAAEEAELTPPPARPSAAPSYSYDLPTSSVNRPILKRARTDSPPLREATGEAGIEAPVSRQAPRRPAPATGEPAALRQKPVIELRRKPVRPAGDAPSEPGARAMPTRPGAGQAGVAGAEVDLLRPTSIRAPKRAKTRQEEEEEEEAAQKAAAGKVGTKTKRRTQLTQEEENINITTLDEVLDDDDDDDNEDAPVQVSLSLARPPKPKGRPSQAKPAIAAPTHQRSRRSTAEARSARRDRRQEEVRQRPEIIALHSGISVHELADELVAPETELIRILFMKGIAANINQILDLPTATMVAEEYGVKVEMAEVEAEARKLTEMLDSSDLDSLQRRPPVVTIMGHVDHGKTTLLDSIRKTKVAQGEAGGITQHIGAYHVDVEHAGQKQQIVFLDTPGHEAFTAMRARGARVTDVAVLVVAADDGVRPQTIEAISHAKAAGVPIVVAINKIDKEEAQPDRVKQELTEYGLVAEEWGGDTIMVPVSAIKGENLDSLLEMLLLVSEVEDLYANPDRPAKGTVIEANLDKAKGPVATLIVQNGTLKVGDVLVAGSAFGKVRAMVDDRGKRVTVAGPSFAVEVLGLSDVPAAGDEFEVYLDEKEGRSVASDRVDQQRQSRLQQALASRRVSLNTLSAQAQEGELKELNLIVKSDVQGSLEAILGSLQQLPQKEVQVRVLLAAPGEITETDVDLAAASSAVIVGFNTTLASGARQAADEAGVDVRDYAIIYKLLEDIQGAMEGLLEPEMVEESLGQAEVRAVFPVGRGAIAGCYILSGKVIRNSRIRVRRGNNVVHESSLDSLMRMKEKVAEVNAGYECGIGVDSFKDWIVGDVIEVFKLVSKRRTLSV